MLVYSTQSQAVISLLLVGQMFVPDPALMTWLGYPEFKRAYQWMVTQMSSKGLPCQTYPVWLTPCLAPWQQYDNPVLVLNVPRELIVWSSLDAWTCALNGRPVYTPAEEDDYCDRDIEHYKTNAEVESTWPRMFELTEKKYLFDPQQNLQGCTPLLKPEWVVKVLPKKEGSYDDIE